MTTSSIPAATWRKSTYSNADGNCVEVAIHPSAVAVRDSKDRAGPVLTFGTPEWCEFLESVRNRQFESAVGRLPWARRLLADCLQSAHWTDATPVLAQVASRRRWRSWMRCGSSIRSWHFHFEGDSNRL